MSPYTTFAVYFVLWLCIVDLTVRGVCGLRRSYLRLTRRRAMNHELAYFQSERERRR